MEAQALEHERRLRNSQGDEALKHAIAAAELYMQAAGAAKTPEDRKRLRRKFTELIALGERLKGSEGNGVSLPRRRPAPVSTRTLTTLEKTIILKASRLHGNVFLPWDSAPSPDAIPDGSQSDGAYIDSSTFSLSSEQQSMFAGWYRPTDLIPGLKHGEQPESVPEELMTARADMDLAQDLATDCSVVASLCAACRHFGPTRDSLLASLMHPFDRRSMRPVLSKAGKYVFRMYFNGSWRQIAIDDRLPASKTERTLYVVDRRNPRLLWPALVEKAYLKIRGGYDFPGSNSGTDLHALTGWIPEQIFLQSDDFELDDTWNRIQKAYDEGNAMLTLGTGNIPPEEEKVLGLVREHDYAVVDAKTEGGSRLLLIKNPWVDSLVWTGVGSTATLKAHTIGSTSDGTSNQFWMAFEDVRQHFDSLYVNWNPALFTHRQDHHFRWELPDKTEELVFTHNPQYSVLSPSGGPVWVLLSRHWQDGELEILRQRKADKDRDDATLATVSKQLGFMALSMYATSPPGSRVPLPDTHRRLHHCPYVDSPNNLLRYESTPGTAQTLVVTQTELPLPAYSFTLSFFSHEPLTIAPAAPPLQHNISITGAWTRRTAGGSAAHPSYSSNPQYALTLPHPSPLHLVLSTSARDLPVHIALLYSPSSSTNATMTTTTNTTPATASNNSLPQRITSLSGRDVLCASAEYQQGYTSASTCTSTSTSPHHNQPPALPAGTYVLVASTFDPGQTAPFTLRISSAVPVSVRPLPASDAAGRLRTAIPGVTTAAILARQSGGGGAGTGTGRLRLRAPIGVDWLTRVSAVVRAGSSSSPSTFSSSSASSSSAALRVALELGQGAHRSVLAVSGDGEFADAARGLRTGEVDVEPDGVRARGGLWVVLERIGGGGGGEGEEDDVQVDVLSDRVVRLGEWELADED